MKNIIYSILSVIITILICSLFMNKTGDVEIPISVELGSAKAFQVGAFKTLESANIEAINKNGIVLFDGEYYCVYISILSDVTNIERMMNYLNDHNTYYYLKDINISSEIIDNVNYYESLMKDTTSTVALLKMNKKIMGLYEEQNEN